MKILITGAGGLIGSEAVEYFASKNIDVYGIENNQRQIFFGPKGSTEDRLNYLKKTYPNFTNYEIDIRDRLLVLKLFEHIKFDVVIHTAAQPSHDKAAQIPFDDFETNAIGTLNLLEAVRQTNLKCVFVHMSTNKVYGDRPNLIPMIELPTRYDYAEKIYANGIPEDFSVDQSLHSIFGASKLAGDILVQEYGRYFGIRSCVLRGGCLTGENHSGVELHGFLNYLVKCNITKTKYTIIGYNGKQVRDNIHSSDVISFIQHFIDNPRIAEVYNIGGGKDNSCSILEVIKLVEESSGIKMITEYEPTPRIGDHICYYSDLSKIKEHYPEFKITKTVPEIINLILRKNDARS